MLQVSAALKNTSQFSAAREAEHSKWVGLCRKSRGSNLLDG
jgi:hypothetical protein